MYYVSVRIFFQFLLFIFLILKNILSRVKWRSCYV